MLKDTTAFGIRPQNRLQRFALDALLAPAEEDVYKRQAMCCAICGGATALSHVNDAGFWLVGTFLEIDEKTTLKSWTIMETLIGITALIVSLIISIFA